MVKKLVLLMSDTSVCPRDTNFVLDINNHLLKIVTKYKDKINDFYKNKSWDKYKKLSNEYEHIYSAPNSQSNISLYNPVSRSFFKLWEVLEDFGDEIGIKELESKKCVFLAEGPGGFFEAVYKKRSNLKVHTLDKYYGMTLKSSNKSVPDWKMNQELPISISYGSDGTGNIYNYDNIFHLMKTVGKNSVDFITADGGFDFSSDFNNQEEQSFRLIICEVLCALLLQKEGGSFMIKFYDCFNMETLKVIHILKLFYRKLYFIKPLTSRPANSERYILCSGFSNVSDVHAKALEILTDVVKSFEHNHKLLDTIELDYNILYNITLFNTYYTIKQIYYIQRTINYINFFAKISDDEIVNNILRKHKRKSIKWCQKYNIPYKKISE